MRVKTWEDVETVHTQGSVQGKKLQIVHYISTNIWKTNVKETVQALDDNNQIVDEKEISEETFTLIDSVKNFARALVAYIWPITLTIENPSLKPFCSGEFRNSVEG